MPSFISRPPVASPRLGDGLLAGMRFYGGNFGHAGAPREVLHNRGPDSTSGSITAWGSSYFGNSPSTSGAGWSATYNSYGQTTVSDCTLFMIARADSVTSGQAVKPIRTSSNGSSGLGLCFWNPSSSYWISPLLEGVAVYAANPPAIAYSLGHLVAVAWTFIAATKASTLWVWDYDANTPVITTSSGTLTHTPTSGDGNVLFNSAVSVGSGCFPIAGWSTRVWSLAEFRRFAADPYCLVRPDDGLDPALLTTTISNGGPFPHFTKRALTGGMSVFRGDAV